MSTPFRKHSRNARRGVPALTKNQESTTGFAQLVTSTKRIKDQIEKSQAIMASRKASRG